MVDFLGWVNLLAILLMVSYYPLKKLQTTGYGRNNYQLRRLSTKIYKKQRAFHPILGIIIIIVGAIHGYLALGEIRLHTGSLILIALILMALTAIFGPQIKGLRKKWRNLHKGLALLLLGFVILHLFWRSLI